MKLDTRSKSGSDLCSISSAEEINIEGLLVGRVLSLMSVPATEGQRRRRRPPIVPSSCSSLASSSPFDSTTSSGLFARGAEFVRILGFAIII